VKRTIEIELYEEHPEVTYYTFGYADSKKLEFDDFFERCDIEEFVEDIDIILYWIDKIGSQGALDRNFRPEIGNLKALPMETSKLRCFCFKINENIVILGNGNPKTTESFNDDPDLNPHAINLLSIGKIIMSQIKKGSVSIYNKKLYGVNPITFEAI
jgi:hypothetical protein